MRAPVCIITGASGGIAGTVAFLPLDDARHITAQAIGADGGVNRNRGL